MIRIEHPRPELGRQSFIGIEFHNGVAEVESLHPERRLALTQHGFTVTDAEFIDLTTLTKAQLIDYAAAHSIELPRKANREQIEWIISAAPAAPVDNPNATQITEA